MQGPDATFTPTAEVDRLAWLPLADARRRLDYQRDAYAIDALEVLADSAVAGPAVLLVSNARAVPFTRWAGAEGGRPLDVTGHEQAEALRRTLPASGHPGCCRRARPVSWTLCDRSARSSGCRSDRGRPSAKMNTLHVPAAA